MTSAAALASGDARRLGDERHGARRARVGLEHVEHVGDQRELHVQQPAHADAAGDAPRWTGGSARARTSDSVTGGSTHAESPEWMPASSMCSMTPPRNSSVPSNSASTSISIASSRKRSMSSGGASGASAVGRVVERALDVLVELRRRRRRSPCRARRARTTGAPAPGSRSGGRCRVRLAGVVRRAERGRRQPGGLEHAAERAAVLGGVDRLRRGAEDRQPGVGQALREATAASARRAAR